MRDTIIFVAILALVCLTAVHTLFPAPPPLLIAAHKAAADRLCDVRPVPPDGRVKGSIEPVVPMRNDQRRVA